MANRIPRAWRSSASATSVSAPVHEHGLAEEVGEEAETKEPRNDAREAGQHRERYSKGVIERGIAGGQGSNDRRDHRARGGVGVDDELS
jgi:hypothetical protein